MQPAQRRDPESGSWPLARGFSSKIQVRTNGDDLPIGIVPTPDEAHDSTAYPDLRAERDSDRDVLLGDRGYDSDPIREDVRAGGGRPEIPTKRNRLIQHSVDHAAYAMRNRIERFISRPKNSRRVATRYDHTSTSFLGFVLLTSIRIWIGLVHAP